MAKKALRKSRKSTAAVTGFYCILFETKGAHAFYFEKMRQIFGKLFATLMDMCIKHDMDFEDDIFTT